MLETASCALPWFYRDDPTTMRVGVRVKITAVDAAVIADPYLAHLHAGAEATYRSTFGGCQPALEHQRLGPGESATGFITFEVPVEAESSAISYLPPGSPPGHAVRSPLPR